MPPAAPPCSLAFALAAHPHRTARLRACTLAQPLMRCRGTIFVASAILPDVRPLSCVSGSLLEARRGSSSGDSSSSSSSGGGGGGGGSGGFSLSELARAFQQMSGAEPTTGAADVTHAPLRGAHPDKQAAGPSAAKMHRVPPLTTPVGGQRQRGKVIQPPSSSAPSSSSMTLSPKPTPSAYATAFSAPYAAQLRQLSSAQLRSEVESQLRRRDVGCMLQCLHEVAAHRLPPLMNVSESDAHRSSRGSIAESPAGGELLRDHRLLTALLHVMTAVDVCAMEGELLEWTQHSNKTTSQGTTTKPQTFSSSSLSHRIARGILWWLSREVSHLDATMSVQVLHLLAQQDLAWSEAVLDTLVDTITVHLTAAAQPQPEEPGVSSSTSQAALQPLSINLLSLLLDTVVRFQTQVAQVLQRHAVLPQSAAYSSTATTADVVAEDTAAVYSQNAAERRAMVERSGHPVANAAFFHVVTEALTRELRGSCSAVAAPSSSPSPSSSSLTRASPTTVLFLTRALSKLHWWSDGLMAALTVPLTAYLQRHPESFTGVVLLVGRPENTTGDATMLYVLQDGLLTRLRRRGVPASTRTESVRGGERGVHDAEGEAADRAEEEDEDDDGMLSVSHHRHHRAHPSPSPLKAATSLSLIDLHAFPLFLQCLTRFHLRTLHSLASTTTFDSTVVRHRDTDNVSTAAVLQAQMRDLFALLQSDLQHSIDSLDSFAATVSSPLLARVLHTLLITAEDLGTAPDGTGSSSSSSENISGGNRCAPTPLIVEVAYVWTQQVSQLRPPPLPPRDSRASPTAADVATFHRIAASTRWRRALRVHHLLVRAGLLQRTQSTHPGNALARRAPPHAHSDSTLPGRYFMPDDVVAVAPRVHAAVQSAKVKLQQARQRALRDLPDGEGEPAGPPSTTQQQQQQRGGSTSAPRFASQGGRGGGFASQRRVQPGNARQRSSGTAAAAAAAAAVLRQPVRSTDVFASYSKAISRLL